MATLQDYSAKRTNLAVTMRVFPATTTRAVAILAALVTLAVLVTGCAPAQRHTVHVVPAHQRTYPNVRVYTDVRVLPNVRYGTAGGEALKLDVCLPNSGRVSTTNRPAIVAIHGGSWTIGDKSERDWRTVCEWLASAGYVTVSVNYRLAPAFPYPAGLHDVEHAVEWLRAPQQVKRFAIDPTLIGAIGGSAGGNLAAMLGTSGSGSRSTGHRVAAVAEFSGPTNLTASGKEGSWFIPLEESYLGCHRLAKCPQALSASPASHIDKTDSPFFISHSTREMIPLVQATSFAKRLRDAGVEVTLVTVAGDQHSIITLDAAMRIRVLAFFATHLTRPPVVGLPG